MTSTSSKDLFPLIHPPGPPLEPRLLVDGAVPLGDLFLQLILNFLLTHLLLQLSFTTLPTSFRPAVTTWEEMGVSGAHLHHLTSLVAQLPTYDYCYVQGS